MFLSDRLSDFSALLPGRPARATLAEILPDVRIGLSADGLLRQIKHQV
jgi:hypothetical protein